MSDDRRGSKHPPIKKAYEIMRRLADVSSPAIQIEDTLLMHFAIAAVDAVRQHDTEIAACVERLRASKPEPFVVHDADGSINGTATQIEMAGR